MIERRARAVNLFRLTAPESPHEFGNLGCPGPKRHLKSAHRSDADARCPDAKIVSAEDHP